MELKEKIAYLIPRRCLDAQPGCKYYEYSKCEKYDEVECRYQVVIADQILTLIKEAGWIDPLDCKQCSDDHGLS